jgi:hypothetical protein
MAAPAAIPDRATDGPESGPRHRAAAGTDAGREVVVCEVVAALGIGDFTGALAGKASRHGTHCRAGGHANRTARRAERCPGEGPAAGPNAGREMVVCEVVAALGIGYLTRALARQAPGDCTDRGSCSHAQWSADGPERRTSRGAAARADPLGQIVIRELVAARGIGYLARPLAREAPSHCTDRGSCGHAQCPPTAPSAAPVAAPPPAPTPLARL